MYVLDNNAPEIPVSKLVDSVGLVLFCFGLAFVSQQGLRDLHYSPDSDTYERNQPAPASPGKL